MQLYEQHLCNIRELVAVQSSVCGNNFNSDFFLFEAEGSSCVLTGSILTIETFQRC